MVASCNQRQRNSVKSKGILNTPETKYYHCVRLWFRSCCFWLVDGLWVVCHTLMLKFAMTALTKVCQLYIISPRVSTCLNESKSNAAILHDIFDSTYILYTLVPNRFGRGVVRLWNHIAKVQAMRLLYIIHVHEQHPSIITPKYNPIKPNFSSSLHPRQTEVRYSCLYLLGTRTNLKSLYIGVYIR